MGNSEWDKYLRNLLGEFKSEGESPHWEEFAEQLDSRTAIGEESDLLADENLKETLSSYKPDSEVTGWDRIEASLNVENRAFDENVRKKINHYEPAYDPHSWSLFLKQISANKLLRVKLIALKTVESVALLLLIMTVVNISRQGKFPFTPQPTKATQPYPSTDNSSQDKVYHSDEGTTSTDLSIYKPTQIAKASSQAGDTTVSSSTGNQHKNLIIPAAISINDLPVATITPNEVSTNKSEVTGIISLIETNEHITIVNESASSSVVKTEKALSGESEVTDFVLREYVQQDQALLPFNESYITETLELNPTSISVHTSPTIPLGKIVSARAKKYIEFGMMAQVDYNQLKMPEDRLKSFSTTFVFPLQGISSPGYGGGFTLALGHPRWALETGLVYSAKTFKPGRQLTIGDEFNNGSVEFEAMRLQLVSVPLQFRYRFEPEGRLKAYALAGFGMHVIVQSDIDVRVKYQFASLAAGENPNNNPAAAQTIYETRRISEDIKDGAPFSTKSFISANIGLGVEYMLRENKTLFLQTAYQYQVPDLNFSNHNGKHILSLSLQAGVRTRLGS
jgi:hypothetical protein